MKNSPSILSGPYVAGAEVRVEVGWAVINGDRIENVTLVLVRGR